MRSSVALAAVVVIALCLLATAVVVDAASKTSSKKTAGKTSYDTRLAAMSSQERAALDEYKLSAMQAHASASRDGIIRMNATGYDAFIRKAPRSYHVFAEWTVLKPSRKCEPCAALHEIVLEVAGGYRRGLSAREHAKHNIFFVLIDYDHGGMTDIFSKAEVQYTPLYTHIRPNETTSLGDKPYDDDDLFDLRKYGLASESLVTFISQRTGVEIDTATPLPLLQIVLGVAAVVGALWLAQDRIARVVPFSVLFFAGWLGGVTFCLSGIMYHYIRKTPWAQAGGEGLAGMVANQQRHQYGVEGVLIGSINTLGAVALIVLSAWIPAAQPFAYMPMQSRCPGLVRWLALAAVPIGLIGLGVALFAFVTLAQLNSLKMGGGYPFSLLKPRSLLEWGFFGKFSSYFGA